MRIRLTDIRNHSVRELDLLPDSRNMPGWQNGIAGWSIGPKGSGDPIELDEALAECRVGVFSLNYQVLLWGLTKELPEVWLFPQGRSTSRLVPFEPQRWVQADREELGRVAMGGNVRLRFDQSPIRFGNYILESLQASGNTGEYCAFCNELLHTYFRVGSQQACPSCAQKFKREMRASLAMNYWRALGAGLAAALAGGLIHGMLLAALNVSFGSVLIGVLVGLAMRMVSKESAGTKYRVTGAVLTLTAGSLQWWRGIQTLSAIRSSLTFLSAFYLAVGIYAAWTIAARNVQTEIHGPFQVNSESVPRI